MTKLRVNCLSVSADGFAAGPDQDLEHPLGHGGEALFQWFFGTRTFSRMHGKPGGSDGVADDLARQGFENVGAWILGRNMFGPIRGPWPDESWRGWWGEEPPYHTPVFVLTHHPRPSFTMKGGTTFHFVTGGIRTAWEAAREAAGGRDVRLGGGASTVRQYLEAGLIDSMHLAIAPVILGRGEPLFAGLDYPALGLRAKRHIGLPDALHLFLERVEIRS